MRFPRTIRFDVSDAHAYERAAVSGECAVSGAFVFADADPSALPAKARQAFASALLGTESFGWSTFVMVAEIDEAAYQATIERLADHLLARYGAPDRDAARAAAREEAAFAASLCEHPVNTLLTVERVIESRGLVERFRVVTPPDHLSHARVWEAATEDTDESRDPAADTPE